MVNRTYTTFIQERKDVDNISYFKFFLEYYRDFLIQITEISIKTDKHYLNKIVRAVFIQKYISKQLLLV